MSNSRIRRRNKCGFEGIGTPGWNKPKKVSYGDYKDINYNHKADNVNTTQTEYIKAASHYRNHAGSAKPRTLMRFVHLLSRGRAAIDLVGSYTKNILDRNYKTILATDK